MLTVLSFSFGVHFLSGTKLRQLAGARHSFARRAKVAVSKTPATKGD
jgi:hypothetical protein